MDIAGGMTRKNNRVKEKGEKDKRVRVCDSVKESMCEWKKVCLFVCVHTYYIYIYMCMCVYVCVCVCMCMCVDSLMGFLNILVKSNYSGKIW